METDGGGWTVFQRRVDGSVDFYLDWADYEEGFGNLDNEFWLGLGKIHRLTEAGVSNTLRIDLGDAQGNRVYAEYSTFNIGDSSTEYTLTIAGYSAASTVADDMIANHNLNGQRFSTRDNDNDNWGNNCASEDQHQAAWWFNICAWSSLNGQYGVDDSTGILWYHWKGFESLTFSEMKIRRNTGT